VEEIRFPNVLVFYRQDDSNVRMAGNQIADTNEKESSNALYVLRWTTGQ
jgi:hypothetical protein